MRIGVSMLELVISIVVMGIVVASVPLVLSQVNENDTHALQQEAIMSAKTKIANILAYDWDENSYQNTGARKAYIVRVSKQGDSELNNTKLFGARTVRVGNALAPGSREFNTTATATQVADLGQEGDVFDDVDDFHGQTSSLVRGSINVAFSDAKNLDYLFDLNLTTTVNYASDSATYSSKVLNDFIFDPTAVANTTNIKVINVVVKGAKQDIVLRAFASNIGEVKPLDKRIFE